jgi:inosine/xanthosine triphosphatase
MNVNIASQNPTKVQAVKEVFQESGWYPNINFSNFAVSSDISDQPVGMGETIQGAINRAKNAFKDCQLSVGIESGMVEVPLTTTGYMNMTACVIYDGTECFVGLGPGFELPQDVTKIITEEKMELDHAMKKLMHSSENHDGYKEGVISLLTKGKITRKEYTKPAIWMALARMKK